VGSGWTTRPRSAPPSCSASDEKTFGASYSEGYAAKVRKHFAALTAAQLDQAFVAMAVAGQMHANQYGGGSKPTRLLEIAGRLGIDAAAVRAELAAADKSKANAKTKPSAKKVVKKAATPIKDATQKKPDVTTPATAKAGALAIAGITFEGAMLRIGDELRVKKTAAGRKTAKDGRKGKVAEILEGGNRIVLSWGKRPHERGVYGNHELERVPDGGDDERDPIKLTTGASITAAAAWPFPGAGAPDTFRRIS
jgi:hypothetical protein